MKLSIFAILLLSLSACQKDCITKSSGKKNNISPIDSNEQNETDNIKNNANQIPLDKAVKNDIKVILQF